MSRNWRKLVGIIGFVEGFWEILANLKPAKPVETLVNPCHEVGIWLENVLNLADASP